MASEREEEIEQIAVAKLMLGMAAEIFEEVERNLYRTVLGSEHLTIQEKAYVFGRGKDRIWQLMKDFREGKFD